ncbi:MAG: hypothetical protein AAF967_12275 [Pseudomonadota bacterium]
MHGAHADPEDLQHTAHMPFQILAHPGRALPRSNQDTNTLGGLAPDMDRTEPAGAGEMCQAFGIAGVRSAGK